MLAMLSSIPSDKQAVMQAAGILIRSLGMIVGFAITSGVFQKILKTNLQVALAGQGLTTALTDQIRSNFDSWHGLTPAARLGVQKAYMKSLHVVFYISTAEIGLAALLAFASQRIVLTM
jgi:hypothetical protein